MSIVGILLFSFFVPAPQYRNMYEGPLSFDVVSIEHKGWLIVSTVVALKAKAHPQLLYLVDRVFLNSKQVIMDSYWDGSW